MLLSQCLSYSLTTQHLAGNDQTSDVVFSKILEIICYCHNVCHTH